MSKVILRPSIEKVEKFNVLLSLFGIFLLGFLLGSADLPIIILLIAYSLFIAIGYYYLLFKVYKVIKESRSRKNAEIKE